MVYLIFKGNKKSPAGLAGLIRMQYMAMPQGGELKK
jgi:hypothetical protein